MIFFTIFLFGLDIGKLSDINVDFVVWLFAINVDFDYLFWCCLTEVKESIGEGMRLRCMQFLKPTCRTWMKEDRNCQYPGPNFLKIAKSERDSSSLLTLLQSFDNTSNPIQFLFGKTVWINFVLFIAFEFSKKINISWKFDWNFNCCFASLFLICSFDWR